jgi:hypothetical protein
MHFTGRKDTLGSALWQAIKTALFNSSKEPGFIQIGNSYEENPFFELKNFGPGQFGKGSKICTSSSAQSASSLS